MEGEICNAERKSKLIQSNPKLCFFNKCSSKNVILQVKQIKNDLIPAFSEWPFSCFSAAICIFLRLVSPHIGHNMSVEHIGGEPPLTLALH